MPNFLQVTSAVIEVSANPHVPEDIIAFFKVTGILPGCRRNVTLSESIGYMAINVRPLIGYSGSAVVHPEDWANLISEAPVVASKFFPVELTTAVKEWARSQALSFITCPAVMSERDVHPNVIAAQAKRKYTEIKRRPMAGFSNQPKPS